MSISIRLGISKRLLTQIFTGLILCLLFYQNQNQKRTTQGSVRSMEEDLPALSGKYYKSTDKPTKQPKEETQESFAFNKNDNS